MARTPESAAVDFAESSLFTGRFSILALAACGVGFSLSGRLPAAIFSLAAAAVAAALEHDSKVVIEEAVPGFEVGCAVLGNEELTVGLVDEIELSGGFFNFTEKYNLITSAIHVPARISPEKAAEIQETAKTLYRALECRGFARVDLFLTPEGALLFNEVNTIPGFTSHSRYPTMMKGIGLDFSALVDRIITLGVTG